MLRAALTSGILFSVGDCINQNFIRKQAFDFNQNFKFISTGFFLHGPFSFQGFKLLENIFGSSKSSRTVALKAITNHLVIFPPYLLLMLFTSALLDGKDPVKHIQRSFIPIFTNGFYFWPLVNMITFKFVPISLRIVWVNLVGIGWNSSLSFQIFNRVDLDV
jgi:protein Mpv17